MKLGFCDPTVAPTSLVKAGHGTALACGADSWWAVDHLINILPRSLWQPRYNGTARLAPRADAFFEPFTLLGWMAARTRLSRLGLGVSVTDAARRHPAVTAQAFATLHILSRGRALLGIGTGERENNEPYGVDWSAPVGRFEEALGAIRALWDSDGKPVSRDGRFFPLHDAVFDVPPWNGTRPPLFVAAHGPRMLRIAGRYADAWMPAWPQTPKVYGERLNAVRDAASDAGRDPMKIMGSGWFIVFTGPTRAAVDVALDSPLARALALNVDAAGWTKFGAEHPLGTDFTGTQDLLPHLLSEQQALEFAARVPAGLVQDAYLAGTPADLLDRLAEYRDHGLAYPVVVNASMYVRFRSGLLGAAPFIRLCRGLAKL